MAQELRLYVSASPEMNPECELLGQLFAGMLKSVKWVIKRTPGRHENVNPDIDALRASQFYLILLGTDIWAPIGVEWRVAQGAHLFTFAFRNINKPPSPAASVFARDSRLAWQQYRSPQEFIQQFEHALVAQLLDGTPGYGLDVENIQELWGRFQSPQESPTSVEEEDRRGASRGGIILPTDRAI